MRYAFPLSMVFCTALVFGLTGCGARYSEVPIAKNFESSDQLKLQAGHHWDVVSKDISNRLIQSMSAKVDKSARLSVVSTKPSPFNRAIESELIATLVQNDYQVLKTAAAPLSISINTEVVEFSPKRIQAKNIGVPSSLVTGVWVLAAADASAAGVATAMIGAADMSRWLNSDNASGDTPKTEIMITITVSDSDRYLAVSKATYYVTDSDKWLYQAAQTKTIMITGEK